MKSFSRFSVSLLLLLAFLSNTMPCGPGYVTPLFDTTSAPEDPYTDYAAGRLGIIKPTFHRSALFAAYRYIAGNGLSGAEQKAMIEVWQAEINNKNQADDTIDEAVKAWVDKRKEVVGKEDKAPEIYAERSYGGYDFFPNCTKNAFETAVETLADRSTSHGPSDPNVLNWIKGQDEVFENCANGKQTPDDPPVGSPIWLQKDRDYQRAAAEFYSLDYEAAKKHFQAISLDTESPWGETADYLVARTLIRQASLTKDKAKAADCYKEAEVHLEHFTSRTGKFAPSAERLMGLIRYRNHPKERVSELAKILAFTGGNENFRQDMIDYNWLLDKFASEVLTAEEKRKEAGKPKDANMAVPAAPAPSAAANTTANTSTPANPNEIRGEKKHDDDLEINIYAANYVNVWRIFVAKDATDEEAVAEAIKVVGAALTEDMKNSVRAQRQSSYASRFKEAGQPEYEGGYYGNEKLNPSLIPAFLRQDDLTDWLYTYQMQGQEAYHYALKKYKEGGSELWLMTALTKADKTSTDLPRILEAANNTSHSSAGYLTIAYHTARILIDQGKTADAKKLIDELLNRGDEIPISARNSFLAMRLKFAETLEDFLKYSLRKPYAFDFDGEVGNVEKFIADQKAQYNPEYNKDGREAYEAEIENNYKHDREWQGRTMFDTDTVEAFNQMFPTSMLIEVEKSPALPDYLRERFVVAIWTRAYMVDDVPTLLKITPELAKYRPEFAEQLERITAAKTQVAQDHAVLYFVLKNPILTPFIEDGTGKTDNEQGDFDSNDWWCAPYDTEYDEATSAEVPKKLPPRPAFLTPAQVKAAQTERKRLAEGGDAPKYLAEKVMDWAKKFPADRRVPEALYIVITANGWTKYGCGNNEEIRDQYSAFLKKTFPGSEWTAKLIKDESER